MATLAQGAQRSGTRPRQTTRVAALATLALVALVGMAVGVGVAEVEGVGRMAVVKTRTSTWMIF